jgi:hypothetical protein
MEHRGVDKDVLCRFYDTQELNYLNKFDVPNFTETFILQNISVFEFYSNKHMLGTKIILEVQ